MYIYTYRTHYLTSALIGKDNFGSKTGVNQVLGIFIYIYACFWLLLGGIPTQNREQGGGSKENICGQMRESMDIVCFLLGSDSLRSDWFWQKGSLFGAQVLPA